VPSTTRASAAFQNMAPCLKSSALCRMRHSRRSCAKMCRAAGGELEQIQLLLGHASVQTTERYLGTKQDLVHAPNDGIKLRVAV
jgi:integrase